MTQTTLPIVALKNSVQSHVLEQTIFTSILDDLRKVPNLEKLRNDVELVNHVCNLVENMMSNNSKAKIKIDKKKLVVNILTKLFNLNPQETTFVETSIDHLFNNDMIVKQHILRKVFNITSAWVIKKLN